MTAPPTTAEITLTGWRHRDERVADLPGIPMPPYPVAADRPAAAVAADLYTAGARRVVLPDPVDLTGAGAPAAAVRALALVRELTSRGIVLDWQLRLGPDPSGWRPLSHLAPPAAVHAGAVGEQIQRAWAGAFHYGKCIHRHGPGFVQIRDRRWGELNRLTLDEPDYLLLMDRLQEAAPIADLPPEPLADLAGESLVWTVGDLVLWLPYRIRRWPWHAMVI